MDSPIRLLLLCILFFSVSAEIDTDVCLPVTTSCGLVPPALPTNFEYKGEHVDKVYKFQGYEEVYFDYDNLRGKYMVLLQSFEYHHIFDYTTSQVISYLISHTGSTPEDDPLSYVCSAVDMEYSDHRDFFGYRNAGVEMKNTRMYDSNRFLRFGGPYVYAFNETGGDEVSDERRITFNKFIGCVYEHEMEITARIQYKFSADNVITSAGSMQGDIDGSEIENVLSVPLTIDYSGTIYVDANFTGEKTKFNFDYMQSYNWFKANPNFDNRNFLIPPWMHCNNYRGAKPMPNFPMAFSVRVETTAYGQNMLGKLITAEVVAVNQLYYYSEKKLARRDFMPQVEIVSDREIIDKFKNMGAVKTIYDFTTNKLYITNKATGRCFSRPIQKGDALDTTRDVLGTELITPEELFLMQQDDMEYKGQYFTRDIECDVWSGKYVSEELNLTLYKETYMTTNGWHEEADEKVEYRVPIKHSIITNKITDDEDFVRYVSETNFFKFKAYAPMLYYFDISECVETIAHKYYAIKLKVMDDSEIAGALKTYRFIFREAAQYYLSTVSGLESPLRIQRLDLTITKDKGILLTFAMIEKEGSISNPAKGLSVEEAAKKLKSVVDKGNFEIIFVNPANQKTEPITAEPGNFFDWIPGGDVEKEKQLSHMLDNQEELIYEYLPEQYEPDLWNDDKVAQEQKKSGMSPGALAGLSIGMIVIGIALGIALMYLYLKKYDNNPGSQQDYVMHSSTNG